jgi:hypothetical protein
MEKEENTNDEKTESQTNNENGHINSVTKA